MRKVAAPRDFKNEKPAVAPSFGCLVRVLLQIQRPEKNSTQGAEEEGGQGAQLVGLVHGPAAQLEVCHGQDVQEDALQIVPGLV